jgi:hypothetical protein
MWEEGSRCCNCHCDCDEGDKPKDDDDDKPKDDDDKPRDDDDKPTDDVTDWPFPVLPTPPTRFDFPDIPGIDEVDVPELDFEFPLIEVPEWLRERLNELYDEFGRKFGFSEMMDGMNFRDREPAFLIYVENPIRAFGGIELPRWRAELDLRELSQQGWVSMLRMMLLFIIMYKFVSAIITVLRQA